MRQKMIFPLLALFLLSVTFAADNPNILFIAVDDLKPILGCYGDEQVQTPNIDALAAAGTVFLNNHCQQAICAPSRVSLLTGMRPDYTQVWDLQTLMRDRIPDILTLPQYLQNNGYETAALGKVFDPRSVDDEHDGPSWSVPFFKTGGQRWFYGQDSISTQIVNESDDEFPDGQIADAGINLLQQLSENDNPFFLAVGFKKPHLPFVAPQSDWELYNRDDFEPHPITEFAEGTPEFAYQPGWELRSGYNDIPAEGDIPENKQIELIHGYYACASFIDRQVGKFLHKLDELNIRDNTIIVLWGDHGWHLGDHSIWCKHTNFEQATRSPLIIAYPDGNTYQSSNSPTEFVDVFPTLCDLAGLPVPEHLHGKSLRPVLENPDATVKDFAVSQYLRSNAGDQMEGYALRTERYRYVEWISGFKSYLPYVERMVAARELYDYETDPDETRNLVDDPDYAAVVSDLNDKLQDFFSTFADSQYVGDQDETNLLWNPSFDYGLSGWSGNNCQAEVVANGPDDRKNIVHISDRTKNWNALRQSVTSVFKENGPGKYSMSTFMRTLDDPSMEMKMQISLTVDGNTTYHLAERKNITDTEWTEFRASLNLNWTGELENVIFYFPSVSEFSDYYVDDCYLTFGDFPTSDVEQPGLPNELTLYNAPNPFNPATTIHFSLSSAEHTELAVYNLLGKQVAVLADKYLPGGQHEITWNGTNDNGSIMPSGVYYLRLRTSTQQLIRKVAFVR